MNYQVIKPPNELADIVRYFWVFEGVASADKPFIFRTLANGCPELLFHYEGKFNELVDGKNPDVSFLSGIHGQTNQFRRFVTTEKFGIFGVFLYPYALTSVFGIPAAAFTNHLPDLHSFTGKDEDDLTEKMFIAKDHRERIKIITNFLIHRKNKPARKEIAFAVRQVIDKKGNVNVSALSSQCFLSHRQFERNFKEHTGFSAKAFSRIIRFNSLLANYKDPQISLTQIALDFGYYDQSHFIHDFKLFSGYSPRTYFSGNATELL
jgi:AraC-like DNA-binding protein